VFAVAAAAAACNNYRQNSSTLTVN